MNIDVTVKDSSGKIVNEYGMSFVENCPEEMMALFLESIEDNRRAGYIVEVDEYKYADGENDDLEDDDFPMVVMSEIPKKMEVVRKPRRKYKHH